MSRFRRLGFGLLAVLPVVLGGCIDMETNIVVQPDGSGLVTTRLIFDEGIEDAIKAGVAFDAFDPQPKIGQFNKGLCQALLDGPKASGGVAPPVSATMRMREFREGDKLVCEFSDVVPEIAKAMQNPLTMSVLSARSPAPGRLEVTLNPNAIPDMSVFADIFLQAAAKSHIERFGRPADAGQTEKLAVEMRRGLSGGLTAFFTGRTASVSFTGKSIVDTTGRLSGDSRTATYVMPISSVLAPLLGRQRTETIQSFRVVVLH